jgi:predicted phosphate transport protein (TIGR00153 family)
VRLIPREEKFYDLFRDKDVEKRVTEIKFVEHKGDQLTHELMTKLNKTFITPMDREDIHSLCSALDDVLDLIDGASGRLITYKIRQITPGAIQLAKVILHGSEIIVRAVAQLHRPQNILEYCDQLSQLEKDADRIKGECVARLFENSASPTDIIKWKEIYEVLEATTDKCEDVADVLESVVLKST